MADYPKTYEKNGRTRTASNRRDEVKLRFDGWREVPTTEEQTWETNGGAVADVASAETPKPSTRKPREN